MEKIRGSSAFWKKFCSDIIAMVKTLGTPSFFFTFSYDDLNSHDAVNALLKAANGESYEEKDPLTIPYEERRQLLNDHPVAASRHFSMRVMKFLKFIKDNSMEIFGAQLVDHTCRIEFQARGSPHAHCLLWFSNVPTWNSPEGIAFLEKNVTCTLEGQNKEIVLKYQTHRHSKTCYKNQNSTCRFGFPRVCCENTEIFDDDKILRNKGKFCAIRRKSDEAMINNYHPVLIDILKCNMDIQPVTSAMSVAYYIAKYISKAEPRELRESIREAISKIKASDVPIQQKMLRISYTLMSKREVSAQEAAFRLCHLPLRHSSRAVKFISTFNKNKRLRMLDREAFQRGEVKFCDNIIERYMNRPDCLERICLFEFVANYTLKRTSPLNEKEASNEEDDIIEFEEDNIREDGLEGNELVLKNNKGRIKRRKRPFVVNYFRFNPIENREEYYYSLLLLYLPFRVETFCDHESPQDVFKNRHTEIRTHADDPIINVQLAQEIESALVRLADFNEDQLDEIELENSPAVEYEEIIEANSSAQLFPLAEEGALETIKRMLRQLTQKQREVFDMVKDSVDSGSYKNPNEATRLWVTGGGGTGKSFLLRLLKLYIQNKLSEDALIVAAPSGRAAHLVGGVTCHRAFSLPVEHDTVESHRPIGPKKIAELRRMYRNVSYIIIDEMSMLSYENLRLIHQRMCEIFQSEELFGGRSIILVGDILQLPPVKGHFIFQQPEKFKAEANYWRSFSFKELDVNKRQGEFDPLLEICNNLRIGEMNDEDILKLEERILDPRKPNYKEMKLLFDDAVRLYATINKCDKYNEER